MKRKILQRVVLLLCTFYGGMHLTAMGLASKFTAVWANYVVLGLGIILILLSIGYCVVKCVLKYIALTSRQEQKSESD